MKKRMREVKLEVLLHESLGFVILCTSCLKVDNPGGRLNANKLVMDIQFIR